MTIEELEQAVADARAAYIKRADKKLSSGAEWDIYAQLLNTLRLRKREMKSGGPH
jgi:hypothetical protein